MAQRLGRSARVRVSFGQRLFASFVLVLLIVGVAGYFAAAHELRSSQIATYAAAQEADARGFEAKGREEPTKALWIREIDEVMDAVAERPGTLGTFLIDPKGVVVAAGDDGLVGFRMAPEGVEAALNAGESHAGHDGGTDGRESVMEFVTPLNLPDGRYAYRTTYDESQLAANLSGLRRTLALVALLTLLVGGGVFYLVGGRALMRSHQMALMRAARDGLTDLPNQRAFHDDLQHAIAVASRGQGSVALAAIDLDDFKFVNDKHGHPEGDALLRRVADVLRSGRTADRVYRTGGDEFAALFTHTDSDGARISARRLHRAFNEAGIRASIGVSALQAGQEADVLVAEADAALYDAKRRGGDQFRHADDIRDQISLTSRDSRRAVRQLLEEGKLSSVFQPIWNIHGGELLGLEALTRPDPGYGLSGPDQAFDIAEQLGLVHELDKLCASHALDVVDLPPQAMLFLNICPQTLDLDSDGNDWLRRAVRHAGLTPDRVVVEVTERFAGRTNSVIKGLELLRSQGFKIALDDVGTGNSGLEMLSKVRAEYVKLDRSIVAAAVTEPSARAVLMAMATFAHQTGAYVIAEGIEDEDILEFLIRINDGQLHTRNVIQGGQGYTLGRPEATIQTRPPNALAPPAYAA